MQLLKYANLKFLIDRYQFQTSVTIFSEHITSQGNFGFVSSGTIITKDDVTVLQGSSIPARRSLEIYYGNLVVMGTIVAGKLTIKPKSLIVRHLTIGRCVTVHCYKQMKCCGGQNIAMSLFEFQGQE